jgi:NADPH:quinone reductase-like Zn-dependent oxidoreductase
MKAAVIINNDDLPKYIDIEEPVIQNHDELLVTVKAAAIKPIDKIIARREQFSPDRKIYYPIVAGIDGVGLLPDGTNVYAIGVSGMFAEKAIIKKNSVIKLPNGLDIASAAALPNAIIGSAMALRFRANIKPGETVLINGATGFTGKIAVQVARHYGAGKIIVTGRNENVLFSLAELGADEAILLDQDYKKFKNDIKMLHKKTPIDIIIDYLWGLSAESILEALKGDDSYTGKTRFISVGAASGDKINLSSEILKSFDLHLTGSGLGTWTNEERFMLFTEIIPEMYQLTAENKLKVDVRKFGLDEIEKVWDMENNDGERVVLIM